MALIVFSLAMAQNYSFPTSAEDYSTFYPTAYKDHGGSTDWNCGGITYSGHDGSDFGVGSWDGMYAGRDIVAAAEGTVTAVRDGMADDCSTGDCGGSAGYGNYVSIQHADGKTTYYGHMKIWSVAVSTGAYVTCGQKIGEVGSSGNSTGPHLHFEVRESSGYASDPFDGPCSAPPIYWVDQGVYDGLPGLVCDNVAPCTLVGALSCGQTIATANNAGGSTSTHYSYGCGDYTYSGPEIAYSFSTNLNETVTLRVTGPGADVDLFVLSSDACDGSGSVGCSISPDSDEESVSFTATAGATYVVVVDGYEGAVTSFNLVAECQGNPVDTGEPPGDSADTVDSTPITPDTGPATAPEPEPDAGMAPGIMVPLGQTGCQSVAGSGWVGLLALLGLRLSRKRVV